MAEVSEVVAVLVTSDPVVLALVVALAAIGVAGMAVWLVASHVKGDR